MNVGRGPGIVLHELFARQQPWAPEDDGHLQVRLRRAQVATGWQGRGFIPSPTGGAIPSSTSSGRTGQRAVLLSTPALGQSADRRKSGREIIYYISNTIYSVFKASIIFFMIDQTQILHIILIFFYALD